jgi:hypothetical protein
VVGRNLPKGVSVISVSGYLTEKQLATILGKLFDKVESEVRVGDTRMRWDYLCDDKFAIEFDGDSHYRDPVVIERDERKAGVTKGLGLTLIRLPYWLQLDSAVFEHFFGEEPRVEIETDFPHGFISQKVVLPASFCKLGYERFDSEMDALPSWLASAVTKSLEDKCKVFARKYVY